MNKIILPPTILSTLLPHHSRIESSDNYLYLLRETFKPNKIVISDLYNLFFGSKFEASKKLSQEDNNPTTPDYFSSYE
jgi:hypothetical protein